MPNVSLHHSSEKRKKKKPKSIQFQRWHHFHKYIHFNEAGIFSVHFHTIPPQKLLMYDKIMRDRAQFIELYNEGTGQ